METLRLKVRDALQEMLFKNYPMLNHLSEDDVIDLTCDIADKVFEVLEISEDQQDIEGAKVVVNGLAKDDVPVNEIQNIIDYLYEDESKDAEIQQEEKGNYEGHIFSSIEEVDNWLNYIKTGNHKVL